ncbi:phage tail sheath protein [Archangium lipolyticum]|uniref:phage tail sheath protein n=1 Tax=Archangium lipolyticum TaxID=2970465 RepID=UPI00214A5DF8|nr:phage tail sheath protein [Archangium lipolyticum]
MSGLVFEARARAPVSAPERADIACFVGFIRRSSAPISPEIRTWLLENGWSQSPLLEDVPAPIERWNDFDRHFDWEGTYLGAAVRSFFAQGGRKCYVIRMADPWLEGADRPTRLSSLEKLLPGTGKLFRASPIDRSTWHGAAHLFGLPDVSFLCLPDLAAAVAMDGKPLPPPIEPPRPPEVFVECTQELPAPLDSFFSTRTAPRCDQEGYGAWARFLERVKELLSSRYLRDVQLVAALPLPYPGTSERAGTHTSFTEELTEDNPYAFLLAHEHFARFQSAFVQLVYPWVRTPGSALLPEELESPDGLLAGVLARNALLRGSFRSVMNLGLADVHELFPVLGRGTLSMPPSVNGGQAVRPLPERVSVLGPTPGGLRVLSDVTTSPLESWRQGGVNRLFSVLIRALRRAGHNVLFEPSHERTWRDLTQRIEFVLVRLWEAGALRGTTAREAFQVRCDRTTMTQDDLDAGRLVAEVVFDAAAAIERIHVVLTLVEGGPISLRMEEEP